VLPLKVPSVVGLTEYVTGTVEGLDVNACVSPTTTLTEAGLTRSEVTVTVAVPNPPEPSAAVALIVADPAVVPAVKMHEVDGLLQADARLPSPTKDQVTDTFELNVYCVPSSMVCDDGVTFTVVGGVEETVIVSWTLIVVSVLASCACSVKTCDPVASDATV
jgi:hypothetical protein